MAATKIINLRSVLALNLSDDTVLVLHNPNFTDDDPAGGNPKDRNITVLEAKKLFKESDEDLYVRVTARLNALMESFSFRTSSNVVPLVKVPIIPEDKLSEDVQRKLNNEVEFDFPGVNADYTKNQRILSEQIDQEKSPIERGDVTFGSENDDRIYLRKESYGGTDSNFDDIEFTFERLINNSFIWSRNQASPRGDVNGEIGEDFGSLLAIHASAAPTVNWEDPGEDVVAIYDVTNETLYQLTGAISDFTGSQSRAIPTGLVSAIQTATEAGNSIKLKVLYNDGSTARVDKKGTVGTTNNITFISDSLSGISGWGDYGWVESNVFTGQSARGFIANGIKGDNLGSIKVISNLYLGIENGGSRPSSIRDLINNQVHVVNTNWTVSDGLERVSTPAIIASQISGTNIKIRLEITYANGSKAEINTFENIPAIGSLSSDLVPSPIQQISKNSSGDIFLYINQDDDLISQIDLDDKEISLSAYIWTPGPVGVYHLRFTNQTAVYHLLNPFLVYDSEHKMSIHTENRSYGYSGEVTEITSIKEFPAGGLSIIGKNSELIPALAQRNLKITLSDQTSGDEGEYRTSEVYDGISAIGNSDSPQYLQAFNENSMVISKAVYDREFVEDNNPVTKIHIGTHTYDLHGLTPYLGSGLGFNGHGEKVIAPFGEFIRLRFSIINFNSSLFGSENDFSLEKKNKSLVQFRIIQEESTKVFSNVEVFGAVNGRPPESFNDIVRPGIFHYGEGTEHTDGPDGSSKQIYQGILQSVYLESGGFQVGTAKTSAIVDPVEATAEVNFFSPNITSREGITQTLHHGNILIRYEDINVPFFIRVKSGPNETTDLYIPDVFANLIGGSGDTVKVTVKIGNKTVERTINLDPTSSTTGSLSGVKLNGLDVSRVYRSAISVQGEGAWPQPSAEGEYDDVEVTMEWTANNVATGVFSKQTGLLHYWISEKQKISKRFQVGEEGSFETIISDWEEVKPSEENKIIIKQVSSIPGDDGPKIIHLIAKNGTNEEGIYIKHTTGTNGVDFSYSRVESLFTNDVIPPTAKVRYSLPDNPVNNEVFKAGQDIYESEERRPAVTITSGDGSSGETTRSGYRSDELSGTNYGSITQDPNKKLGIAYTFSYQGGPNVTLISVKETELPSDGSGGYKDLTSLRLKTPNNHVYSLERRADTTGSDGSTVFRSYAVQNTGGVNLFPVGQKIPIDLRASGDQLWPDLHFEAGKNYQYSEMTGLWSEFTGN